jgi:hypothetical protein
MKTKTWLSTLSAALGLLVSSTAFAEPVSVSGHITTLRTGWNADAFAVVLDVPMANPFGCVSPDGYILDKTMPGYDTLFEAAKLGFAEQPVVEVTFDGARCYGGRPVLIGLNLYR